MKSRIIAFASIVVCASALAFTQEKMAKDDQMMGAMSDMQKTDSTMLKKGKAKDYLVMKNGTMMVVKNGKSMMMEKTMMMPNGSTVMTNGEVMTKAGKKTMMKDGMMMDMNGKIVPTKMTMQKKDSMMNDMKKDDTNKDDMMKKN